jgi:chromosome partitioning protein
MVDGDSVDDSGLDNLLQCEVAPHDILRKVEKLGVDFIPPGRNLRDIAADGSLDLSALKLRMNDFKDNYHFVLIDCPPSSDFLSASALMAADSIIIPIQTETLPLQAGIRFLDWLGDLRMRYECHIDIMGILPCMYDSRTRLSKLILDAMRTSENLGPLVFNTVIRKNATLAELPGSGKSIFRSASTSFGAIDYSSLAAEVIEKSAARDMDSDVDIPMAAGEPDDVITQEALSVPLQSVDEESLHPAPGSSGYSAGDTGKEER